ncbi:MAG: BrnA antitoxin family protein, partial [Acetobacteraceae bacterium]|nr:BrnA antitoxin family protein [Acetobacteraceae bacterium]
LSDDHIDTSDIPPLSEAFWVSAVRNPLYRPVKRQLTVRLDADVLAWLRSTGRGYQTKLNEILRQAMLREVVKNGTKS